MFQEEDGPPVASDDPDPQNNAGPSRAPDFGQQRYAFSLSAQTARGVVHCVECRKPRLFYSKTKLTDRQSLLVAKCVSEFDYTCGSDLVNPEIASLKGVLTRKNMTCGNPVEMCYYSSKLGQLEICCYCAVDNTEVNSRKAIKQFYLSAKIV